MPQTAGSSGRKPIEAAAERHGLGPAVNDHDIVRATVMPYALYETLQSTFPGRWILVKNSAVQTAGTGHILG